jgi:hypothetical protein
MAMWSGELGDSANGSHAADQAGEGAKSAERIRLGESRDLSTPVLTNPVTPTTEVRSLSNVERAWLAGVIDGEGSIFVAKIASVKGSLRRDFFYRPALEVSNSNREFVEKVRSVIGKGWIGCTKEKRGMWKDKWQYEGSSRVLKALLPQLLPHLVLKREVAREMLNFLAFEANPIDGRMKIPPGFDQEYDSLYWRIKQLNQKGSLPHLQEESNLMPRESSHPWSQERRGRGSRTQHCRVMDDEERAWLAGVIDGEGAIFLSKVKNTACRRGFFYLPQIAVSNTHRELLVRVGQIIGEGTVCRGKKAEGHARLRWQYQGVSGVLRSILPQVMPLLIVKRPVAEKMLEFLNFMHEHPLSGQRPVEDGYYDRLDSLYQRIKKLNEKGKPRIDNIIF